MVRTLSVAIILSLRMPVLPAQDTSTPIQVGTVSFRNSCTAAVQPVFNRSVALLHSFEFSAATEGFLRTAAVDPQCGIAYWGAALSAWGNPFAAGAKSAAQLERGLAAIRKAQSAGSGSQREMDFVSAAARLFENYKTMSQSDRLQAYSDAMSGVTSRYPDDIESSIFYPLSLAASANPADKSYGRQLKAGAILEKLAARYPNHPGLAHYIIHSYDLPALAARALHAAHQYSLIAPALPHALHMPSHTFTRVGSWEESIAANAASTAAARRDGSATEELHASDYLMYAYLQSGRSGSALRLLDSLPAIARRFDPAKPTGAAPASAAFFAIAAMPARYALERGAWSEAAHLATAPSPVAWASSLSHFATALGAARSGDTSLARSGIGELERIHDKLVEQKEMYWAEQTTIQLLDASAWLTLAEGNIDGALKIMREAADREGATEKNAVTPGPLAPARELLGEMLQTLRRPREALVEFQQTLRIEPNRFRTVAGAMMAADSAGNRKAARSYAARLLRLAVASDGPPRPELARARKLVSGR